MKNTKSIAIAIADTQQHTLAANALFNSISQTNFDQVIIFSDKEEYWGGFNITKIPPIKSIKEYNKIILKELSIALKSDYVLIIQYDGFIIRHNEFDNSFLEFDYIGAPWYHLKTNNVGNGGFSLRSKRLVDFVADMKDINFETAEDVLICQHLKSSGILDSFNFAPIEIAKKFSFEYPIAMHDTFGFHGVFNLPLVYQNNLDYLIDNIPEEMLRDKFNLLFPTLNTISSKHADLLKEQYEILKGNS